MSHPLRGAGIQSLRVALYAAGARTSIMSLSRFDDAATRRRFDVFYTNPWIEKLGKVEVRWLTKCPLREDGDPVRDWAGWVSTGGSGLTEPKRPRGSADS